MQKKKKKKRKKLPDDGGRTLEQIKYYYPKAEEMRKGYINLSSEEKKHITEWMLRKGMKPFYAVVILETALMLAMIMVRVMDIGKQSSPLLYIGTIVMTVILLLLIYVLLKMRNRNQLKTIDFDKVEEVLLMSYVSNKRSKQRAVILRWDEEKEKFYEIHTHSELYLTIKYNELVYHPHGTQLFIPK